MPSPGITKKMIAGAMKEFMTERPLSKITVGDIIRHCEINRNTFYYHFKDKFDLVNWIFYTEFVAETHRVEFDSVWGFIDQLTSFFYKNKAFYKNALSEQGSNCFTEYFGDLIKTGIMLPLDDIIEDNQDKDFYADFFIDAFIAAISRWLREGAKIPPETLTELMKKAATGVAIKLVEELDDVS